MTDGAPIEHCGLLDAPSVTSACAACDSDDADCQNNGCYGGWWCNSSSARCERPPMTCP
jgi:hypothetical protein